MFIDVERSCFSVTNVGREVRISIFNKHAPRDGIRISRKMLINSDGEVCNTQKSLKDSLRRAKKAVVDYALCNDFDFFGTFTLSDELCGADNIQNPILMQQQISQSLEDYKRLYAPNLEYLFVPELGEKKRRLHFHFLVKGIDKTHLFINEKHKLDWAYFRYRFGWVQITPIGKSNNDRVAVAKYCSKYISKGNIKLGNMRYFCSKTLAKPIKEVCDDSYTAFLIKDWLEMNGMFSYIKDEKLTKYVDSWAIPRRIYRDLLEFLIKKHHLIPIECYRSYFGAETLFTKEDLKKEYFPRYYDNFDPFTNPELFEKPQIEKPVKVEYIQCAIEV